MTRPYGCYVSGEGNKQDRISQSEHRWQGKKRQEWTISAKQFSLLVMLCKPGLWSLCGCSYPQCFQLHVRMPFIKVPGRQKNGKRSCRFSIKLSQIWLRRNHGDQYNSFLQRASVAASATQWCSPAAMVLKHTIDHHDMFYYNTTFCQKKTKQFSIEKWSLESLNVFFSGTASCLLMGQERKGTAHRTGDKKK